MGNPRDWVWRGWQTRYTYLRPWQSSLDQPKPPILFLHGFGASMGHWQHNLAAFSQDYPVYALDLLGFGASEKASAHYLVSLWMDQVYEFWRTLINEPVILVGNSLGSLVSLGLAARYPEMVVAIAMLNLPDASVMEPPTWTKPILSSLQWGLFPVAWLTKQIFTSPPIFGPFFRLIRQPRVIRFWVKKAYASPEAVTDELVDLLVGPTHDRGAAQALRAMFMAKARPQDLQYNAAVILPQLTLPMLLIWGRQDQMVPSKLAPLFVQCNPKVQLIELDQAGHCPQDECPQLVNQAILSWINTWNAVPNLQTSSVR